MIAYIVYFAYSAKFTKSLRKVCAVLTIYTLRIVRYDKGTTKKAADQGKEENTMKQYKGYYIDKVIFNSEHDIDEFIRNQAIKAYKDAVEMFAIHSTIENSLWCEEKAERLVNQFGFTWEQVEELEIATLKEIA